MVTRFTNSNKNIDKAEACWEIEWERWKKEENKYTGWKDSIITTTYF